MHLLEPMSAEPIASLYESADQPLPSSSASSQFTPRLNFAESQIAVVMLMMLGSSGLTKTSDRVFSHSTSPHHTRLIFLDMNTRPRFIKLKRYELVLITHLQMLIVKIQRVGQSARILPMHVK